jgi:hypothetical protein
MDRMMLTSGPRFPQRCRPKALSWLVPDETAQWTKLIKFAGAGWIEAQHIQQWV